jgi:hypothetical protein
VLHLSHMSHVASVNSQKVCIPTEKHITKVVVYTITK